MRVKKEGGGIGRTDGRGKKAITRNVHIPTCPMKITFKFSLSSFDLGGG